MKIRGREIGFLRTVKATCEISKLCPNQDLEKIDELFSGTIATALETGAQMIHLLNEGFEKNKQIENPDYDPQILSVDEIMNLPDELYTELMKSALENLSKGTEVSVEVEQKKKKVKN